MKKIVIISCFGWEKRVETVVEELERNFEIIILTADFSHSKKIYLSEKKTNHNYIHVYRYKKNISIMRMISHYDFARKTYYELNKIQPDIIYALIPPNSVAKYCMKYKFKHKEVKLIFDVIDMWPESMPIDKFRISFLYKIWTSYRNRALQVADYVFTECELYQFYLKEYLPTNYSTLHLYKEMSDECIDLVNRNIAISRTQDVRLERISIAYLGSINHIIDIDSIVLIIKGISEQYNVDMHIIGKGESQDKFIKELNKLDIKIYYYGAIYDEKEKIKILAMCDYALNIMKSRVNVGLTIKSIDYLSYGLPLINNIKGDTWKLVDEKGIGINYDGNISDLLIKISKTSLELHEKVLLVYRECFTKEIFIRDLQTGLRKVR